MDLMFLLGLLRYDHDMRLARVDYKPIDFGHHGNVFAGRKGVQTDIQDFVAGVSYQIDKVGNGLQQYFIHGDVHEWYDDNM